MSLMLYSVNWPTFIVWLLLFLEILGNMCIAIVCYPCCDVMSFEINLIFLIKPFFFIWPKTKTKSVLRTKRAFLRWNKKTFFIIFKGLLVEKVCLRPDNAPLTVFRYDRNKLICFWIYVLFDLKIYIYFSSLINISVKVQRVLLINLSRTLMTSFSRVKTNNNDNNIVRITRNQWNTSKRNDWTVLLNTGLSCLIKSRDSIWLND